MFERSKFHRWECLYVSWSLRVPIPLGSSTRDHTSTGFPIVFLFNFSAPNYSVLWFLFLSTLRFHQVRQLAQHLLWSPWQNTLSPVKHVANKCKWCKQWEVIDLLAYASGLQSFFCDLTALAIPCQDSASRGTESRSGLVDHFLPWPDLVNGLIWIDFMGTAGEESSSNNLQT